MTDEPTIPKVRAAPWLPQSLPWRSPPPALQTAFAKALLLPTHYYPWPRLDDELNGSPTGYMNLVGYGSLINLHSAGRTLSEAGEGAAPILAFGVQRVFNYTMPEEVMRRYPPISILEERAVLNAYPTGRTEDFLNGVLLKVVANDLSAFRQREPGYDLVPVCCLSWHHLEDPPVLAYTLACPDEPRAGRTWTNSTLLPHREYLRLCLDGARNVSPQFLQVFLETTYLADRHTILADWKVADR
jgi:hypothetical protein